MVTVPGAVTADLDAPSNSVQPANGGPIGSQAVWFTAPFAGGSAPQHRQPETTAKPDRAEDPGEAALRE